MRFTAVALYLCSFVTFAQLRGPIHPAPLSDQELAEVAASLADSGYSDEEIRTFMELPQPLSSYREAEFRRWFPELIESDKLAYSCSVATSEPAKLTVAFVRTDTPPMAHVSTLHCAPRMEQIYCSLEQSVAYYLRDPSDFFYIDQAAEQKALAIVRKYQLDLAPKLSDRVQQLPVHKIRRSDRQYVLELGRPNCGCTAEVRIREFSLFGITLSLRVSNRPQAVCI